MVEPFFAAVVAIGATRAVEKLGGRLGGLAATLPSTIVPASLGLFHDGSPEAFKQALWTVPGGMLVNAAYLWTWRVLPARLPQRGRLAMMVPLSLAFWATGAAVMVLLSRRLPLLPFALGVWALTGLVGAWACRANPPAPAGTRPVPLWTLALRGVLAAAAVVVAMAVARSGEGLLAGVAAVFPAIFLTTMLSLDLSQGSAVRDGAIGPMMLGSASVGAYALVASWSLPALGEWGGASLAWILASFGVSGPAWWWLKRQQG